jgi:hypothetical protein
MFTRGIVMKTIDFFYAAQKTNRLTDAQMARALEITTAAIAQAKKREHLSAYNAAKCAEMAGLDAAEAIAAAAIEAEHEPAKREYLQKLMKSSYNSALVGSLAQLVEQRTLNP